MTIDIQKLLFVSLLYACGWDNNLSYDLLSKFKFGVCDFDAVTSIFRLMSLPLHIFIEMKASKYMPIKNIKINYNHNGSVFEVL